MKRDIADFVDKCPNCQKVKVQHLKQGVINKKLNIPTWKFDVINVDFVTGSPSTCIEHDSIWDIVDRVTKSAFF